MCKKCKLNGSIKKYTNPCPSKAISINLVKLNNLNNLNIMQVNTSEKSCYKNVVTNNINVANDHITMKNLDTGKTQHETQDTKECLGVMAVRAIMEPATESQSSRAYKLPLRSRPSNKIRVLLDSGSDGDRFFLQKGKDKPFPYLTRQVPKSWNKSNGSFQTNGRGKVRLTFFEYSASRAYTIQPDIVEYDGNHMTEPGFDLILGCNTMKELGIVLDFWTKEITVDDISLPMRDINKLKTRATVEQA